MSSEVGMDGYRQITAGYSHLDSGCACKVCSGCNRLELENFSGVAICPECDEPSFRVDLKTMTVEEKIAWCKHEIEQMKMRPLY